MSSFYKKYIVSDDILGCGESGDILICHRISTLKKYALKQLKNSNRAKREIEIQLMFDTTYVVKIVNIYSSKTEIFIVMEYAERGDLFDILLNRKLSENESLIIFENICEIVQHLHSKNITHSDIKPENILYINNYLKLTDFGFSRFSSYEHRKACFFTLPYSSPEQIQNHIYSTKGDIWSLGIILYSFIFDSFPFEYDGEEDDTDLVLSQFTNNKLTFDENIPCTEKTKHLISIMLNLNPNDRPNIDDIISYLINVSVKYH